MTAADAGAFTWHRARPTGSGDPELAHPLRPRRVRTAEWPRFREVVRAVSRWTARCTQAELAAAVGASAFARLAEAVADPRTRFSPLGWQGDLELRGRDATGKMTFQFSRPTRHWASWISTTLGTAPSSPTFGLRPGDASTVSTTGWWTAQRRQAAPGLADARARRLHCDRRHRRRGRSSPTSTSTSSSPRPQTTTPRLLPGYDQRVLGAGTSDRHIVRRRSTARPSPAA